MEDSFDKFIADHRESFDSRDPDPRIWNKVEADIRKKKGLNGWLVLRRAAVVVIIFGASYATNEFIHRQKTGTVSLKESTRQKDSAMPGFKETEAYYAGLVNQKLDELKPILAHCPSLVEELNYDMSELDSTYADLKRDLKDNMANQEVIEAIIENYRLKINILEDLLTEIKPKDEECLSNLDKYAL
jgi:hypothetical protein